MEVVHNLGINGVGPIRMIDRGEEAWPRVQAMIKQNPRKVQPVVSADALAAQAAEALRLSRFKEAIELYKQLLKGEARQDWRDALATAYVGRAKALSAKGRRSWPASPAPCAMAHRSRTGSCRPI
jgi:hypothetical protein